MERMQHPIPHLSQKLGVFFLFGQLTCLTLNCDGSNSAVARAPIRRRILAVVDEKNSMMKRTVWKPKAENWLDNFFYCPSCTTWRTSRAPRQRNNNPPLPKTPRRSASTLSSSTAVNATKSIPQQYSALYAALGDVGKKASAHVNLSRLQLALQGLESAAPVIRVAVLGIDVQTTARRLVRLLLADALEDEASWERELLRTDHDYSQGLLIRYGHPPNPSLPQPRTSIPILYIPVSVLERNNIEILISSVNGPTIGGQFASAQTTPSEIFFAPTVSTPTAANGRQTVISQPVHGSLVVAEGLDELLVVAELLASTKFSSDEEREAVNVAADLAGMKVATQGRTMPVNAAQAEEGLAAIRRSIGEATVYEHKWNDSGMPSVSQWLTAMSSAESATAVPTIVMDLVASLLKSAKANLETQARLNIDSSSDDRMPFAVAASLESAIEDFSRNAHQELQSGLTSAWSSRNWRKLAWYKLFWRVDDVGLIITDLITNAWLPRTERAVYELSGRLTQVGISPVDALPPTPALRPGVAEETAALRTGLVPPVLQAQLGGAESSSTVPVITNPTGQVEVSMTPIPQPIPISSSISQTRAVQISRAITELTTTAQQLVFRTLSITGLSAGLSGLTYVSLTPGSVYEAGTIVALGTAFALWRMQGGWMIATKALEDGLFDEGRNVIQRVVGRMKDLVNTANQTKVDGVEERARREAETAVDKAMHELAKLDDEARGVEEKR